MKKKKEVYLSPGNTQMDPTDEAPAAAPDTASDGEAAGGGGGAWGGPGGAPRPLWAKVSASDVGEKLDKFVRRRFPVLIPSKSQCHKAFKNGQILVNGQPCAEGLRLVMIILLGRHCVLRTLTETDRLRDGTIPVKVLYEDDAVAVIWKPAGTVLQGKTAPARCLAASLPYHLAPSKAPDALVATPAALHPTVPTIVPGPVADIPAVAAPEVATALIPAFACVNHIEKGASGIVAVAKTRGARSFFAKVTRGEGTEGDGGEVPNAVSADGGGLKKVDGDGVGSDGPPVFEGVWRAMVHGKVGAELGLAEGDEFALEGRIDFTEVATRVKVLSFTRTRNSPEGWLTTVEVTPLGVAVPNQVRMQLHDANPIIGNSRFTKQIRTCKDKGMFLSLVRLTFTHPVTKKEMTFTHEEPQRFESLRIREARAVVTKAEAEERELEAFRAADQTAASAGGGGDEVNDDEDEGDNGDIPPTVSSAGPSTPAGSFRNVAYRTGRQTWAGLAFTVNPSVMIPRKSTECLVDAAVRLHSAAAATDVGRADPVRVLDLGTGSGCILISLAKRLGADAGGTDGVRRIEGWGFDASEPALEVARANAVAHGLAAPTVRWTRGTFAEIGDAFPAAAANADSEAAPGFSIITCNPPYLSPRHRTVRSIDAGWLQEEPAMALFAGDSGYEAYVEIRDGLERADARFGGGFARDGCLLVLEVGHGMAGRVKAIFEGAWHPRELGKNQRVAAGGEPGGDVAAEASTNEASSPSRFRFVETLRDARKLERCVVFRKTT
ncbi:hypothetical protein DFJ73DRAFT_816453 [Zopfochytrium polystomum]|nr:hypothetical protein DFJ73DRAFT_816453 [Zopfochytrium polystomum]